MKVGEGIETLLAQHPCLQGLSGEDLCRVAGCSRNVRVGPGEYLFREGQAADHVYFLRHGRVALEVFVPGRDPVVIQTLGAGEMVGWSWFFPPYRWHLDARAVELTRAVAVDAACLREKCESDPRFGYELLKRLSQAIVDRLQATRLQLVDMYGHPGSR
jgi:CRP/FNR family transcriptional regulator, cyclic AMP receptor protein